MPCMLGSTWWLHSMRQKRTSASNSTRSDRRKVCAPPSNGGAISSRNTRTDVTEDEVIRELSRKARELLQKMIAREVSGAVCRAAVLAEVTISSSCGSARHPGPGGY